MVYPLNPYKRISLGTDSSGRPLVVNARTKAMLDAAEKRLGINLTIVQGSYRNGAGATASAGTHDRGGVVDIRTWDIPAHVGVGRVTRVLRDVGFAAWYRTQAQGFDPHIHAVAIGDAELPALAASQVTSYRAGRTGLASNLLDPQPYRPTPIRAFNYKRARFLSLPKINVNLEALQRHFRAAIKGEKAVESVHVARLQRALNGKYGLGLKVDGKVGPRTLRGYRLHERKVGIAKPNRMPDDFSLPKLLRGTRYRMV